MMIASINPYRNTDFFGFFSVLTKRIFLACKGQVGFYDLVSDEIQLISLILLCICSAPVGFFLFYRKMTMMANALCHTILLGMVVAFLIFKKTAAMGFSAQSPMLSMNVLLISSLVTALLTTLLVDLLIHKLKVQKDASIGIIFTTLFALGVVLVTLYTKNLHLGTEAIMGNIDALDRHDVVLLAFVSLINIAVFALFFRGFRVSTFDSLFSSSIGLPVTFLSYLLMALTAFTSIAAFRAVGVLLVLTFFVAPPLMAKLLTNRMKNMFLLCLLLPCLCSIVAVALSRHLLTLYNAAISTSGLVVTLFGAAFLLAALFSPQKGLFFQFFREKIRFFSSR